LSTGADLFGGDLLPLGDPPVEITVPRTRRMRGDRARLVVVRSDLRVVDRASFGRLPATSLERTAYDLARRLPRLDAIAAVDALCHRRIVTVDGIRDYHRDRAAFRRDIAMNDAGWAIVRVTADDKP
jgi:very-short-patch-repair endonuclease